MLLSTRFRLVSAQHRSFTFSSELSRAFSFFFLLKSNIYFVTGKLGEFSLFFACLEFEFTSSLNLFIFEVVHRKILSISKLELIFF